MNNSNNTIRIFSPVIIYNNDNNNEIDNELIKMKKEKINKMLKNNVEFWSYIIENSKHITSPPNTPPPSSSNSTTSSLSLNYSPNIIYYHKDESSSTEDDDEEFIVHNKKITNNKKIGKHNNGRRRRGNLPKSVTAILKQWLIDHHKHPYPTEEEKMSLKVKTNLTLNQISNWFINARRRILPHILSMNDNLTIENIKTEIYLKKKLLKNKKKL